MYKKIMFTVLLIIWMIVIFMFSNADGTSSKKTSDKVAETVINTASEISKKKLSSKEKEKLIKDTRFYVRKFAHFTIYLILGILVYLTFKSYGISDKIIIYGLIFCLIYSISDEIHQMFSIERSPKILDIIIDTIGSYIGLLLMHFFTKKPKFLNIVF